MATFRAVTDGEPDRAIPSEVMRLLADHVSSFERLAVVIGLAKVRPSGRTAVQLADEIHLPCAMVEQACDDLAQAGVVASDRAGLYRSPPADAELAATCDALCALYAADQIQIVSAISSLSFVRLRSMAAEAFANAFRFRKRSSDGDK